jgi:hypothetical protein
MRRRQGPIFPAFERRVIFFKHLPRFHGRDLNLWNAPSHKNQRREPRKSYPYFVAGRLPQKPTIQHRVQLKKKMRRNLWPFLLGIAATSHHHHHQSEYPKRVEDLFIIITFFSFSFSLPYFVHQFRFLIPNASGLLLFVPPILSVDRSSKKRKDYRML